MSDKSKDQMEKPPEITDNCAATQEYQKESEKYRRNKLLYDSIYSLAFDDHKIDNSLKQKLQDIIMDQECSQVMNLDGGFSEVSNTLLGITHLGTNELTYGESSHLNKILTLHMKNLYNTICEEFHALTGRNIHKVENLSFKSENEAFFELKTQVETQQVCYLKNLLKKQELLESLAKLRLKELPDVCERKLKECTVKMQMNELQSRIVCEKTRTGVFAETSNSLSAYKELIRDVKEQQEECQVEILHLKDLQERYKRVSSKQFEQLLTLFVQYKSSLERKKLIFESVHS